MVYFSELGLFLDVLEEILEESRTASFALLFLFLPSFPAPSLPPSLFLSFFNFHESSQGNGLGTVTKDATVIKNQYEFLYYKPVNGSIIFLF